MVQFCDELKIASHYIINTESIVKYSFVVLKSVAHLDLSLCELSSLRGKRKPNYMISPFSIIVTSNFVCTEEGCRKNLAQNRKLLYDFHLDVSCELELRLENNQTDEKLRYHSDSVLLNKMRVVSLWFKMCLNRMATHALQETNQEVKLLHQISKIAQRISFIGKHGYIRTQGSDILFSKCRDSNIVKDYLVVMDFGDGYLLKLRPQVVEYLLYHASCVGYSLKDHHPREDLINSAICRRKFEHAELLLQYRDAPRFCVSAYAEMKKNLRVERDLFPHLYIRHTNDLQIRERSFLFLQIFYVFYFDRDSGLKSLQLVWRSIPYAVISVDELITSYPGLHGTNYLENICNFFRDITGKETVYPEPRSLKHYCRTVVRNALSRNAKMFSGIDEIGVPPSILSYLKLEY